MAPTQGQRVDQCHPPNVVPTPTGVHSQVTAYYNSAVTIGSQRYSHLYEWVRQLPYEEQHRIGLEIWTQFMIKNGYNIP